MENSKHTQMTNMPNIPRKQNRDHEITGQKLEQTQRTKNEVEVKVMLTTHQAKQFARRIIEEEEEKEDLGIK